MPIDQSGTPPPPPPSPGQARTDATPPESQDSSKAHGAASPLGLRADKPSLLVSEVAWLLGAGFLTNLLGRQLAFATVLAVIPMAIVGTLILRRTSNSGGTRVLLGAAASLLPWLALRTDEGLVFANIMAILALLAIAAGFSARGSVFDSEVRGLVAHLLSQMTEWIFGYAMVGRLAKRINAQNTSGSILRGAAIAVPVILVFGGLLASADEVFARFLLLDNLPAIFGHLILTAIFATIFIGLFSRAAHETPPARVQARAGWIGRTEVAMVLSPVVLLFAAFTVTQVVVAFGGAAAILETEGLSQADHARSGFFQLMWVTVLASALVGVVRWAHGADDAAESGERPGRDIFTPLALLTLLLTIAIAGVSLSRFAYYIGSFGLSRDRIWAMAIVVGVIVLIVLYMVSLVGWRNDRGWYPGVALLVATGLLFALNLINPSSLVAEINMERTVGDIDISYLSRLPDDAIPAIVTNLDVLNETDAAQLQTELCTRPDRSTTYGALEYNRSAVRADQILDNLCSEPRPDRDFSLDFD